MAFVYFEHIIDLGDAGLLTLTLDTTAYLPLPAVSHGYARWHSPDGHSHDRLKLCTRAPGLTALQSATEQQRARFGGAVASVKGRVRWVAEQLHEEFREAPTHAAALDGGRVLLLFGGVVGPKILRIIDVPAETILTEESFDALANRLGCRPMFGQRDIDATAIASGGPWWAMWLGRELELLTLREGYVERATTGVLRKADRLALTEQTWFIRDDDPVGLRILDSTRPEATARSVTSQFMRTQGLDLVAAGSSGLCVLAHPGGVIELIDAEGRSQLALRPFVAMSRKDVPGLGNVSASGRYLLCGTVAGQTAILDLRRAVQTFWPTEWDLGDYDPMQFAPEVQYRAAEVVTDQGLARLHRGELSLEALDAFDWQPALPAARKRTRTTRNKTEEATWVALRRPALALVPDRSGNPGCQLYGQPHLAQAADWPRHAGRPMLLLCQLDLAQIPTGASLAPLPDSGALLFFVAVDEAGEPLLEEDFNPVAVRVLHLAHLAPSAAEPPPNAVEAPLAQPLTLAADPNEWPQPDATNVAAQRWSVSQLDAYRHFLDSMLPEGPANGHRLGGYPAILQHNDLELDAAHAMPGSEPAHWRLLLQLDSDDVFMWGTDSGILYFMIEEQALAARDFTHVVALTQGY